MDRTEARRRVGVADLLEVVEHHDVDVRLTAPPVGNGCRHEPEVRPFVSQVQHQEVVRWIALGERIERRIERIGRSAWKVRPPDRIETMSFPGPDQVRQGASALEAVTSWTSEARSGSLKKAVFEFASGHSRLLSGQICPSSWPFTARPIRVCNRAVARE